MTDIRGDAFYHFILQYSWDARSPGLDLQFQAEGLNLP
jgi:hypothetical protein